MPVFLNVGLAPSQVSITFLLQNISKLGPGPVFTMPLAWTSCPSAQLDRTGGQGRGKLMGEEMWLGSWP